MENIRRRSKSVSTGDGAFQRGSEDSWSRFLRTRSSLVVDRVLVSALIRLRIDSRTKPTVR